MVIHTDICGFLSESLNNGSLSGRAKEKANALIKRSKNQIEAIEKSSSDIQPYLDMKPAIEEYVEPQPIYSPVDETVIEEEEEREISPENQTTSIDCPYASK